MSGSYVSESIAKYWNHFIGGATHAYLASL